MTNINSISKKNLYLFLTFILFYFIGFNFVGTEELDISRYYTLGNYQDTSVPSVSFIIDKYNENFDFIYFYILYLLKKYGLNLQIINGSFVGLYYFFSVYFFYNFKENNNNNRKLHHFIIIVGILTSPFIIIFSISRLVASIVFMNIAIYLYFKKKYHLFSLAILVCLFTHTAQFLFLILILVSIIISKRIYFSKKYKVYLIVSIILSIVLPTTLVPLISKLSFFGKYDRYLSYLTPEEIGFNNFDFLTIIYYILFALFFIIIFYYKAITYKLFRIYFFIFLFMVFNLTFSINTLQRCVIFLYPLMIISIYNYFTLFREKSILKEILKFFIAILIIVSILTVYGYRDGFKF